MQLTYDEIIDVLDLKYIPTKRTGYSLNPGIYEVIDLNNTLNSNVSSAFTIPQAIDKHHLYHLEDKNVIE